MCDEHYEDDMKEYLARCGDDPPAVRRGVGRRRHGDAAAARGECAHRDGIGQST